MNILPAAPSSLPTVKSPFFTQEKEVFETGYFHVPEQAPYSWIGKVIYVFCSIITLGLVPLIMYAISRLVFKIILASQLASHEERTNLKEIKRSFIKYEQKNVQEVDLKLYDGTSINGMAIFTDNEAKNAFKEQRAENQKWIIRFNGRNGFYETNLLRSQYIGRDLGANMLVFNYRGVAESKGTLSKPEELIMDGEACVRYLLSKGVREENIILYGSSLGGGVVTQVASFYEKMALINERSFASLSLAASVLAHFSFIKRIFLALGCELDSLNTFPKIKAPKLIIFHKQDPVMPYQASSLYKHIKESIKRQNPFAIEHTLSKGQWKDRLKSEYKPLNIKLQRRFKVIMQEAHLYYLQNDDAYPEIRKFVKKFFAKTEQTSS